MIAVVIPTFGRPDRLRDVALNATQNTVAPHRVIFVVEESDEASVAVAHDVAQELPTVEYLLNRRSENYAGACNTAYAHTDEPWLFCGADDLDFHYAWDQAALDAVSARRLDVVIGTNDLLNPYVAQRTHSTHSLFSRFYLDGLGGVVDERTQWLNESYDHNYTDTEAIDTARWRGCFVPCMGSVVEHNHFSAGRSVRDDTYDRGYAHEDVDRALYASRLHLWGYVTNHRELL